MTKEEEIYIYRRELQRLRRENLKLKAHMQVLVSTPRCNISRLIRASYQAQPTTTILN
jgi:hypothetical protein